MDTTIGCFEDIVVVRGIVEDVSADTVMDREVDTVIGCLDDTVVVVRGNVAGVSADTVLDPEVDIVVVVDVVGDTVLDTIVDFVGGFCRGYSSGGHCCGFSGGHTVMGILADTMVDVLTLLEKVLYRIQ